MSTLTVNIERERLLKLAQEYQEKGYEVSLHPNFDELPEFLRAYRYRPDMIVRRGEESVIIEVKSRSSLNISSEQLRTYAKAIEKMPGWRLEFVMINPEEETYSSNVERSLKQNEIESQLQTINQLSSQHLESAFLFCWSLVEATLRLVTEQEFGILQRVDPLYLIKQLATEGVISRTDYKLLMNALSLRNAIAHGFKTTQLSQNAMAELIKITEQLLQTLKTDSFVH